MAIVLGKAFFWDEHAGSDGQACASCHFHAGADNRITNQLSPGLLDLRDIDNDGEAGDRTFGGLVSTDVADPDDRSPAGTAGMTAGTTEGTGQVAGPNITLATKDFPFHKLQDLLDRNSTILYTTNDVVSSQGTFDGGFVSVTPRNPDDVCDTPSGDIFHTISGSPARKVEPRNTPTVVNAVLNFRNFWDGRANNVFNGVDPFGRRSNMNNPLARVLELQADRSIKPVKLELLNSSLPSQAVGPPLSSFEMSCDMRSFADIGRKLLTLRPLQDQLVHPNDSVLGSYRHSSGNGLRYTYSRLIRSAFDRK